MQLTGFGLVPHFAERDLSKMRIGDYATGTVGRGQARSMRLSAESGSRRWLIAALSIAAVGLIALVLVRRRRAS